jgi:hypothetical protein
VPPDVARPGKIEKRTVLLLAAVLAAVTLLGLAPLGYLGHFRLWDAPAWARAVVLAAIVQSAFAAWMVNAPDWAAVRVQMFVATAMTALYGLVMAVTVATPVNSPLMLGLGEVRRAAPAWCSLMVIVTGAVAGLCWRTAARWRQRLGTSGGDAGDPERVVA